MKDHVNNIDSVLERLECSAKRSCDSRMRRFSLTIEGTPDLTDLAKVHPAAQRALHKIFALSQERLGYCVKDFTIRIYEFGIFHNNIEDLAYQEEFISQWKPIHRRLIETLSLEDVEQCHHSLSQEELNVHVRTNKAGDATC